MLKKLRAILFLAAVAISLSLGGSKMPEANADYCSRWVQSCYTYSYACYTGGDGVIYYCVGQNCTWRLTTSQCCGRCEITIGSGISGF